MKLTAEKHSEIKKIAEQTGVSEEALVDLEHVKALLREGGLNAVEKAGYAVYPSTKE